MIARLLGGLLDRFVLVAGTVAGGCLPGFVTQYRQRVGGRLDQVQIDLAPFRAIADRLHGGSLDSLIQHHLASSDATFHAEGAAIQAMVDSETRLRSMYEALQGGMFEQLWFLVRNMEGDIARATWEAYLPSFNLDAPSLIIAAIMGLALWLVFTGIRLGITRLVAGGTPGRRR